MHEKRKKKKKEAFSVVPKASPWRPNHVTICLLRHSGESLQNCQLELRRWNWYFARETHKDTAVSVWACQAGFWKSTGTSCQLRSKPHAVLHGVCEIALTEVLATQMDVMRRSKKVSSFELYKLKSTFASLRVDCAGARALLYLGSSANCYSSRQFSRPA